MRARRRERPRPFSPGANPSLRGRGCMSLEGRDLGGTNRQDKILRIESHGWVAAARAHLHCTSARSAGCQKCRTGDPHWRVKAKLPFEKLPHGGRQWKLFFSSPFSPLTERRRESATGRGRGRALSIERKCDRDVVAKMRSRQSSAGHYFLRESKNIGTVRVSSNAGLCGSPGTSKSQPYRTHTRERTQRQEPEGQT